MLRRSVVIVVIVVVIVVLIVGSGANWRERYCRKHPNGAGKEYLFNNMLFMFLSYT